VSGILLASAGNSYGSAPVNTVAPVVSGTASFGSTLTTTNGTWTGAPAPTFTYQWQRVTTNISGATSSTYVLVAADVGNTIRCVVTATNAIAPSGVAANSNSTSSVAAVVPGAPTIGTATQTGSTTATVTFTAPASNGGATITQYDVVSSPAGGTGTLVQAGSGTINVTGLTGGTSYTFTVKATNSAGQSAASAASNSITTPLAIGQSYQGGYYAGQISTTANGVATHNLVVAPKASGATTYTKFRTSGSGVTAFTSVIDGPGNSAGLAALGANYPAATYCEGLSIGGYTDWYLPAKNELATCYYYLKQGTSTNNTDSGSTAHAVSPQPASTNYTSGSPSQTSATIFRLGNSEAFYNEAGELNHWTSTDSTSSHAWAQDFSNNNGYSGRQRGENEYKSSDFSVRAIRRVAV
jgi:hypothetical protein